ncbi:MAG: helicase-associated domain-containing protein [Candidatus Latescibacterota bacterium]
MVLRAYLRALPLASLQGIADQIGIKPGKKLLEKLVNEIDLKLFDRSFLKRLMRRLPPLEQRELMRLVLAGPRGLTNEEGTAQAMRELVRMGLAYAVGWRGRPEWYVMPEDIREGLSDCAEEGIRSALAHLPKGSDVRESGLALVRDLFVFLSWVDHNGIALTGQGNLYRRTVRRVLERFEIREELPDTDEMDYPPRFGIIAGYSTSRNLVARDRGRLHATGRFEKWLELSDRDKVRDLFLHTLSSGRWNPFLLLVIIKMVRSWPSNQAVRLSDLSETIGHYGFGGGGTEAGGPASGREWVHRIMQDFYWLGVVGLDNEVVDQAMSVSLTRMGRAVLLDECPEEAEPDVAEFFVQPNFEILVPRVLELKLRHQLERFSDLVSVDQMLTYRIGRDSVYRAAERGMKAEEMISFLETYSKVPLPQNLRYSIIDWAERFGEIEFRSAFLLCTQTPQLADEIKASEKLAPFIKGELSPSVLIVPREKYPTLLRRLQESGYFPKTDILGEEEESVSRDSRWSASPHEEPFSFQRVIDVLDQAGHRVPGEPFVKPEEL